MREYKDFREHYHEHISRAAHRYVDGLERLEIDSNPTLMRAVAERTARETLESYERHMDEVYQHNVKLLIRNHKREMRRINREGWKLCLYTCPPVIAMFTAMAVYSVFHDFLLAVLYEAGAGAFLILMISCAIFNKRHDKKGG